ncbi:hypothetical protein TIFTF001_029674 [Ficus carica]|uniref:Uncharacterized protein n=1 Tax=Ficus carica TaxID=3494 RepID=A0AA88DS44_FICCA|nr:hypothetical protein TIFTF001_029674 [Ficus carica]
MEWIESLDLTIDSDWRPWFSDNREILGYTMKYTNNKFQLTYATVKGGGHTAPQYYPEECFRMFDRLFGQGKYGNLMGQGTFGMKTEVKGMKSISFPDPLQARSVHWLATTKVILLCGPSQQIRDGKMLGCNIEPQNSHDSSQQIRDGKMLVCARTLVCVCASPTLHPALYTVGCLFSKGG